MNPKPDKTPEIEPHLSVPYIAEKLDLGEDLVRRLFAEEPGVLHIGYPTRLVGRKYRRRYVTLRIPLSVFLRVRDRLLSAHPVRSDGSTNARRSRPAAS